MFGLTSLGLVHTAIAMVSLVAGYAMVIAKGRISVRMPLAKVYIWGTALTSLTGFGIFQHGGFNIAHALGILTLLVLGLAVAAGHLRLFGNYAAYVETLGFSATLFFHMVPGITETFTRFPREAPLFSGPEDPSLQTLMAAVFLVFVLGGLVQVRQLRRGGAALRQPRLA